jgi:hypothetical protein
MTMNILFWLMTSCATPEREIERFEPTFFEVTGVSEDLEPSSDTGGEAQGEKILEYSNAERTVVVTGATLDREAQPYDYNGRVKVSIRPGVISSILGGTSEEDPWGKKHWYVQAVDGQVTTTVTYASASGQTRVWLTAAADPGETASGHATGVTETIPIQLPTIPQMQDVSQMDVKNPHATSPLFGEFVTIRTEDRQVVVTEVGAKGFWVSDLGGIDETPAAVAGEYRGLFVYSFNKPEGVAVGDRLGLLGGGVQEYVGVTQLSFPLYEPIEGETLPVPAAAVLPPESACEGSSPANDYLEAFESSLVTIELATIPANFQSTASGEDAHSAFETYDKYWQWPIKLDSGCELMVISNIAVPGYDPTAHAGETIGPITGLLSYVQVSGDPWILLVRGPDDMPFIDATTEENEEEATDPAGPTWPLEYGDTHPTSLCEHDHVGDHLRPTKD